MTGKMAFAVPALTALLAFSAPALAADQNDTSLTDGGKFHVHVETCGQELCGRIVRLRERQNESGADKLDIHNRDETLRTRTILGIELLTSSRLQVGDDGVR